MAVTQEQIDALVDAIARGERRVRFEGREVEYRSVDEMLRALQALRAEMEPGGRMRLHRTLVIRD